MLSAILAFLAGFVDFVGGGVFGVGGLRFGRMREAVVGPGFIAGNVESCEAGHREMAEPTETIMGFGVGFPRLKPPERFNSRDENQPP
jgi:hypothetical protein